jgi:hypothetical protein
MGDALFYGFDPIRPASPKRKFVRSVGLVGEWPMKVVRLSVFTVAITVNSFKITGRFASRTGDPCTQLS